MKTLPVILFILMNIYFIGCAFHKCKYKDCDTRADGYCFLVIELIAGLMVLCLIYLP